MRRKSDPDSSRNFIPFWKRLGVVVPVSMVAIAVVAIWHFSVLWFQVPAILLPGPEQVLRTAWDKREVLLEGTKVTFRAAFVGLLASIVLGTAVAILFSQSRHIRNAFLPYVIFLQTVPIVAIAPLLITWTGYTFKSVVFITLIISVFPIISNVTAGLVAVDRNLEDLFRIYKAGRFATMFKLRIPTAIQYLVLGMRISSGLAVIGAIMGDFFVGSGAEYKGLGTLMTYWGARQQTDAVIAALFASTFLGITFFVSVSLLEHFVLRRWTRPSR